MKGKSFIIYRRTEKETLHMLVLGKTEVLGKNNTMKILKKKIEEDASNSNFLMPWLTQFL